MGRPNLVGRCDICAKEGAKRFALSRYKRIDGVPHGSVGMGAMFLCEYCWNRYARPRMRNSPLKVVA